MKFISCSGLLFFSIVIKSLSQDTTTVSLLFAGDIMGHGSQINSAYEQSTGKYNYGPCFQFAKHYLESPDLTLGNLELTLAGPPYSGYPQFSSPDALAYTLKDVGFDVLVTANNHSVDRGRKGIERTISVLDTLKILHTGTFTEEVSRMNDYPLLFSKQGINFSLLNYTFGTNGIAVPNPNIVNLIDTVQIRKDLEKSQKSKPDITIVFMHWGIEYESLPSKQQKEVTEFCFNHGADLVIGAHPHVLQPMEWRKDKNKLVVYSLGNFVSGQRDRYKNGGAMAYVCLQKIRYTPDSIVTTIDSAGYYLQYVHRTDDSEKDYYILPVPSFEKDTTGFLNDIEAQLSLRTFAKDSRTLFGKYNINMREITSPPADSIVRYKVHIKSVTGDAAQNGATPKKETSQPVQQGVDTFYGVETETTAGGTELIAGNFLSLPGAEKICQQFILQGKQARVVKYVNGKRE